MTSAFDDLTAAVGTFVILAAIVYVGLSITQFDASALSSRLKLFGIAAMAGFSVYIAAS